MTAFLSTLDATLGARLPAFLGRQRWFAGKARALRSVDLEDLVAIPPLADGDPALALAVTRVAYEDGGIERYTLPVADAIAPDEGALIAARGDWPGRHALVEASGLTPCMRALLAGFETGHAGRLETRSGGALVYADAPEPGPFARHPLAQRAVRPLGAEQSNTSLLVDREYVFKMFRRLETGENPEVEVGRFLTMRTDFRAMPLLHGSVSLERGGERHTVGVLQSFVENDGDGWRWTLARLASWQAGTHGSSEAHTELTGALRALGETTAAFHAALATPAPDEAFTPRALTPAQAEAWSADVRLRLARTLDLLARTRAGLGEGPRALAERVLAARPALEARAAAPDAAAGGFDTIRIHGDYHLGQTLRARGGWILMDFEGEPARPLAERRALSAALKDVAGMLRSFDYAVVAAGIDDARAARPLRDAWRSGYDARAGDAAFLPAGPARTAWTAFFELEKALYEIEYEIHNRPDWLSIPLRGVLRVLEQTA